MIERARAAGPGGRSQSRHSKALALDPAGPSHWPHSH